MPSKALGGGWVVMKKRKEKSLHEKNIKKHALKLTQPLIEKWHILGTIYGVLHQRRRKN